jgi:uncharacterized protein YabE (DUF348 family)
LVITERLAILAAGWRTSRARDDRQASWSVVSRSPGSHRAARSTRSTSTSSTTSTGSAAEARPYELYGRFPRQSSPPSAAGTAALPPPAVPAAGAGGTHVRPGPRHAATAPLVPAVVSPAPVRESPVRESPAGGGRAAARRAARRKRTADSPAALRRLAPQALVLAFLAGGTSAFVAHDKSVRLSIDGGPHILHTFADDVAELLEDEGVEVGPHDLVAPAPEETLDHGDEVVVRYGRPLALTLDGRRRRVWTTARTVDGALRQLGVRVEGAHLSAARHAPVPRRGLGLTVWTERTVTFMADGRERTIRTNAATVREAVDQAGIVLRGQDTTSVPQDSFPRDGQTISVLRITGTKEVREEPIPFRTVSHLDPSLFQGTEVVVQQGLQGAERVTYSVRTVNGVRQKPKKLRSEVVRRPRDQVVHVGTRPLPRSVAGADGLNWAAMARCESGGRPDAVDASGTYGGLYQFDTATWHRLGGRGRPQDAPPAEQTYRAKKLYVQRGASPWPHCGRKLHQ